MQPEFYRTVIDCLPLGIVVLQLEDQAEDSSFRFTFANQSSETAFGIPLRTMLDKSLVEVLPSLLAAPLPKLYREVITQRETRMLEDIVYSGAGVEKCFRIQASPLSHNSVVLILQDITKQKQILDNSAETRKRLADSRESERLRLAQKLHEGPLQDLIGLRFHLGVVLSSLQQEAAKAQLTFVQDNLQTAIESVRSFCVDLRPPALGPFGLEKAIRAHIRRFQLQFPQLNVMMDLDPDEQRLPERMRLALYRIFQQALDNVARHAQAGHVRVSLRLTTEDVQLKVIDDGIGFELPHHWIDFARKGCLGLLDAIERAEAMGGRLEVTSALGAGTMIFITTRRPLNNQSRTVGQ